jgi:hypothetical protein
MILIFKFTRDGISIIPRSMVGTGRTSTTTVSEAERPEILISHCESNIF